MSLAAFKIVTVKRPLSQEVLGYRMVLAHINRAQYHIKLEEMVQSFQARFRIAESGDYTAPPTPEQMANWLDKRMSESGVTAIQAY